MARNLGIVYNLSRWQPKTPPSHGELIAYDVGISGVRYQEQSFYQPVLSAKPNPPGVTPKRIAKPCPEEDEKVTRTSQLSLSCTFDEGIIGDLASGLGKVPTGSFSPAGHVLLSMLLWRIITSRGLDFAAFTDLCLYMRILSENEKEWGKVQVEETCTRGMEKLWHCKTITTTEPPTSFLLMKIW